jgi:hypothetical protein
LPQIFGPYQKQVAKFDEVFYVKVKKQILATKKPWLATIFVYKNVKNRCFATGFLR